LSHLPKADKTSPTKYFTSLSESYYNYKTWDLISFLTLDDSYLGKISKKILTINILILGTESDKCL